MIFMLKNDPGDFEDKVKASSASFRSIHLYGQKIIVAWPDQLVAGLTTEGVQMRVVRKPYALSSREFKGEDTLVRVGEAVIGDKELVVAAGPCSVENGEEFMEIAGDLKKMGVNIIRGGAFKPRTSPYSFTGLGEDGIRILNMAREELGLPIVSEVLDARTLPLFKEIDMLQIGARNAQNFPLLESVGESGKPVLLKRGMQNTVDEWLSAADYVLSRGNGNVVLCERGIRTFETSTRFALDIGSLAAVKSISHLPICADPSHSAGKRRLVEPLALAAVAAGAQMLLVEVHPNPDEALSDSEQQVTPTEFQSIYAKAKALNKLLQSLDEKVGRFAELQFCV